jgi:hypothetical protein
LCGKDKWKEAFAALDKHYASVQHAETEDVDAETEAITAKKGDDDEDEPDLFDEPGLVEKLRPLADGIRTTPEILYSMWNLIPEQHSLGHNRVRGVQAMEELLARATTTVGDLPPRSQQATRFALAEYKQVLRARSHTRAAAT